MGCSDKRRIQMENFGISTSPVGRQCIEKEQYNQTLDGAIQQSYGKAGNGQRKRNTLIKLGIIVSKSDFGQLMSILCNQMP